MSSSIKCRVFFLHFIETFSGRKLTPALIVAFYRNCKKKKKDFLTNAKRERQEGSRKTAWHPKTRVTRRPRSGQWPRGGKSQSTRTWLLTWVPCWCEPSRTCGRGKCWRRGWRPRNTRPPRPSSPTARCCWSCTRGGPLRGTEQRDVKADTCIHHITSHHRLNNQTNCERHASGQSLWRQPFIYKEKIEKEHLCGVQSPAAECLLSFKELRRASN